MAAVADPNESRLLHSDDELLEPFFSACKPPSEFRVGAEAEKFGLLADSLAPVGYDGALGVSGVMNQLVLQHGYRISGSATPLLSLEKAGASVTLEPGAQLELSGAPLGDMHAIWLEFESHMAELQAINNSEREQGRPGFRWLGLGYHPLASQNELPWVPKPRYGVMREYLPTKGARGLDMMRRTATVQANFDYQDEASAMRVLRVGLRMTPICAALFANSPFVEGKPFGGVSQRADVWLDVDPTRQGMLPQLWDPSSGFRDYVEWVLDAPMFLLLRPTGLVRNTGQTFRDYLANGFQGHRATMGDWVTHINSMFPEVRLKRTIEVRGGDSLPHELVVAPAALYTGLFYDSRALAEAEELLAPYSFEELSAIRPAVVSKGLRAELRGVPLAKLSERLISSAIGGLKRRARLRADGRDESVYLEPLQRLVEQARCPADDLLDRYEAHGGGREAVIKAVLSQALV